MSSLGAVPPDRFRPLDGTRDAVRTVERIISLPDYRNEPETSSIVRLSLLGGFRLRAAGRLVSLPMSAQRLVAFLALHQDPLTRIFVAGKLWPEASEGRAFGSLRSTLWRIGSIGHPLVDAAGRHLRLSQHVAVDIQDLELLVRRVRTEASDPSDTELDYASSWGELLPDWYDEWLVEERERLRQIRLHALELICQRLITSRRFDRAVEIGLAAVGADPLRESAHRALIRAHAAEGNWSEAIRQYGVYRKTVESELGFTPRGDLDSFLQG